MKYSRSIDIFDWLDFLSFDAVEDGSKYPPCLSQFVTREEGRERKGEREREREEGRERKRERGREREEGRERKGEREHELLRFSPQFQTHSAKGGKYMHIVNITCYYRRLAYSVMSIPTFAQSGPGFH